MMANGHPDEPELLAHVDEGPRSARGREVATHVGECPRCSKAVGELQSARAALRAAPRLELSQDRRAAISAALAEHAPRRRSYVTPMRVAAIVAPVAVVAVLIVAVDAVRDGGGGDAGGDAAPPADVRDAPEGEDAGAGEDAMQDEAAGGATDAAALAGPVASVAGPPADVLRILREAGLTARLSGGRVVVSDATPNEVVRALRGRRSGRVPVLIE